MGEGAAVNFLRALMDASTAPRDDRWEERRADIPRLVKSAAEKFREPAAGRRKRQQRRRRQRRRSLTTSSPTCRGIATSSCRPRETWPASSVNARVPPVALVDADRTDGKQKFRARALARPEPPRRADDVGARRADADRRRLDQRRRLDRAARLPRLQPLPAADHRARQRGRGRPLAGARHQGLRRQTTSTSSSGWRTGCSGRTRRSTTRWCSAEPGHRQGHDAGAGQARRRPVELQEVSPQQVLGRFNGFLKSVILRVSEARDLGDSTASRSTTT